MEPRKVALGGLMLFLSSATLIGSRAVGPSEPLSAAAVASLLLAVGSLLFGTRQHDRPA